MADMVEVFQPAFSNKSGVKSLSGTIDGDWFRRSGYYYVLTVGKDVFLSKEEARAAAEVKRVARIAYLEKQLAKLRSLNHAA